MIRDLKLYYRMVKLMLKNSRGASPRLESVVPTLVSTQNNSSAQCLNDQSLCVVKNIFALSHKM